LTNPPGHLWRAKCTALSGPLSVRAYQLLVAAFQLLGAVGRAFMLLLRLCQLLVRHRQLRFQVSARKAVISPSGPVDPSFRTPSGRLTSFHVHLFLRMHIFLRERARYGSKWDTPPAPLPAPRPPPPASLSGTCLCVSPEKTAIRYKVSSLFGLTDLVGPGSSPLQS